MEICSRKKPQHFPTRSSLLIELRKIYWSCFQSCNTRLCSLCYATWRMTSQWPKQFQPYSCWPLAIQASDLEVVSATLRQHYKWLRESKKSESSSSPDSTTWPWLVLEESDQLATLDVSFLGCDTKNGQIILSVSFQPSLSFFVLI